ncbi:MAG: glutathione S-transferase family protein [Gammaproteobacteria bacterium]|nr:glutathione S-transferase family protein [Gammaproteobacteria bacterium]MBU1416301.1 glutathione S-transferase family protein [Gammaproteobacteria bacterium]
MLLYIANKNYSSWSLRPWVLLRQLDIPFEERLMPFGGESYTSFSPSGRVPCLVDGDTTVWDSLAIAEYLAENHAGIWPADKAARAWARCASAEMHSGFQEVRNICTMNCGLHIKLRDFPEALRSEWERIDSLWREGLDRYGGPFLAGPTFSAVDAFFAPVAFRVQTYSPPLSAAAARYAERLLQLSPMREWYAAALAETWRDAGHEADARAAGETIADLRGTSRTG